MIARLKDIENRFIDKKRIIIDFTCCSAIGPDGEK
ncbi:hypothetical protein FHW36_101544 [Chitinophaga polysaccharea]|uniref:Uncharacterized protein n=1 Tax=Chitinophaga polysaccharea TaxID=1293035 RepID=A0A561Q2N9_9BACT|nr:hypothetical protein FHW36_101544 [Chitinophaga polysaccharea]